MMALGEKVFHEFICKMVFQPEAPFTCSELTRFFVSAVNS